MGPEEWSSFLPLASGVRGAQTNSTNSTNSSNSSNSTGGQDAPGEDGDSDGGSPAVAVAVVVVIIALLALAYYCYKKRKVESGGDLTEPLVANEAGPSVGPLVANDPAPSADPFATNEPAPSQAVRPSKDFGKSFQLRIQGTNLEDIGGDEDKAARKATAQANFDPEGRGVGFVPGVEVWRIEKKKKSVSVWPKEQYGQFHRGDAYIVLSTTKDPEEDKLQWDVYFWIGSQCSPLERGVAAVKAVELDDLLDGDPMQHREVEGMEAEKFLSCFPQGVTYLEGGVDYDFSKAPDKNADLRDVRHLYRVVKEGKYTRYFEVPFERSSLNEGDAFMLDAGTKIFTWFGKSACAFETSTSAALALVLKDSRLELGKDCEYFWDVGDDNDEFWELLGGRGEIAPAEEETVVAVEPPEKHMYVVSDADGYINVNEVPMSLNSLVSEDVFIIDCGDDLYVWVGENSTTAERVHGMEIAYSFLEELGRYETTAVHRIKEGQGHKFRRFLVEFEGIDY